MFLNQKNQSKSINMPVRQLGSELNSVEIKHLISLTRNTSNGYESGKAKEQLLGIVPNLKVNSRADFQTLSAINQIKDPELSLSLRKNPTYNQFESSTPGKVSMLLEQIIDFAVSNPEFFDGIHASLINTKDKITSGTFGVPLIYDLPGKKVDTRKMLKKLSGIANKNASSRKEALPILSDAIDKMTSMFSV